MLTFDIKISTHKGCFAYQIDAPTAYAAFTRAADSQGNIAYGITLTAVKVVR